MKISIIYYTKTGNTKKIAQAIASVLKLKHDVRVMSIEEATETDVITADIVGLGSGIYAFDVSRKLTKFINALKTVNNKKAFLFTTSGMGSLMFHKKFKKVLNKKGFNVISEFACKGYNKGRPNEEDLEKAKNFAKSIF